MKFLVTFLSAATLLAHSTFASPLGERGIIEARVTKEDYPKDPVIQKWVTQEHTQDMFATACSTTGGWESWAQLELEHAFKKAFQIDSNTDMREQSKVFEKLPDCKKAKVADFLLPETDKLKGMIIELKCENNKTNTGDAMEGLVTKDKDKSYTVKAKYESHTFLALAMAYTDDAQRSLKKIGMKAIPGAQYTVKGKGTMSVYKEIIPSAAQLTAAMDDLTQAFENLYNTADDNTTAGNAGKQTTGQTTIGSGKKNSGTTKKDNISLTW